MPNPWFRTYNEIIEDEKIRMLAFEDRWHFIAILCCKNLGLLDKDEDASFLNKRMAIKLGVQLIDLDNIKKRLIEVKLIDENWQPINWMSRQFKSDCDETARERKRRQRERNNLNKNNELDYVTDVSRVTGTDVTRTDTDTDTDTDTEIISTDVDIVVNAPKKEKLNVPFQEIVDLYHEVLPMLPQVYKLNEPRKQRIKKLYQTELEKLDYWKNYFTTISRSKFLTGNTPPDRSGRVWRADFDFIINETNFVKIAENKYHV